MCTITNTRKSELKPLVPMLECVLFRGSTPEQAVWGYRNDNAFAVLVPIGDANGFAPAPADRGQPKQFEPGRWTDSFQTPFGLTWTLAGHTATASSTSPRCTAIIELRKVLAPADDPGIFNLLLNGQVLATGGNGTTAGPYTVGVGEGTVSETAGPGTNLSDYESTVTCTRNGTVEVSVPGTKVDGSRRERRLRRLHLHQPPDHDAADTGPPGTPAAAETADAARPSTTASDTTPAGPTGRPDDREDRAAEDGRARPKDHLDGEGEERLLGRGCRRERGQGLRELVSHEADLGDAFAGNLLADELRPGQARAGCLGDDHRRHPRHADRGDPQRRPGRLGGAGIGLPQQHRLEHRPRRRPLQAAVGNVRLSHPGSRARAAPGRHDLDRAHNSPRPVRDTGPRGEGADARAWSKRACKDRTRAG